VDQGPPPGNQIRPLQLPDGTENCTKTRRTRSHRRCSRQKRQSPDDGINRREQSASASGKGYTERKGGRHALLPDLFCHPTDVHRHGKLVGSSRELLEAGPATTCGSTQPHGIDRSNQRKYFER